MQFVDFSPPPSPSLAQQQDALQKGLGRAHQWAMAGRLDDEPLLAACLCDQRFDVQVEDSRGAWLWRMIQAVDAADRFRAPILHALNDLSDDRNASQLCELAHHYAEAGDETLRTRLYEIVEQKPLADCPWLGEREILQLDGEKGLLFAARVRGRLLANREWHWEDGNLIDDAVTRFGEERVRSLLKDTTDEAIRRIQEGWNQEKQRKVERKPYPSHKERMRAITVSDVIAEAEKESPALGMFRGWGMHANETDLDTVLQHLWGATRPKVIVNLLRIISNRALPKFDSRLIELCEHNDDEVRHWAFNALEKNAHPEVRALALAEIQKSVQAPSVVGLFITNYEQGDEQRIVECVNLPDDPCEFHWLLMDVIKVLENNPKADCSQLGLIAYASTPCENCRCSAARLLHDQHIAPKWLTEECQHDSGEECRKLAG